MELLVNDVIIIGAGPIGIACALECEKDVLVAMGAVPSAYVDDPVAGTLRSPWGKYLKVDIVPMGAGMWVPGVWTHALVIEVEDMPLEVCTRLASFDANTEEGPITNSTAAIRLYNDDANTQVTYVSEPYYAFAVAGGFANGLVRGGLTPAGAGQACGAASENNRIQFSFWLQS